MNFHPLVNLFFYALMATFVIMFFYGLGKKFDDHKPKSPKRYYGVWVDMVCPKCKHEIISRDRIGLQCHICDWTSDDP